MLQGGNYQDYFAKKMALLKEKGKSTFTPELSAGTTDFQFHKTLPKFLFINALDFSKVL